MSSPAASTRKRSSSAATASTRKTPHRKAKVNKASSPIPLQTPALRKNRRAGVTAPRVSRKRKVEENVAYTEAEADSVFGANSINPGELLPNAEPENQAPIRRARKKSTAKKKKRKSKAGTPSRNKRTAQQANLSSPDSDRVSKRKKFDFVRKEPGPDPHIVIREPAVVRFKGILKQPEVELSRDEENAKFFRASEVEKIFIDKYRTAPDGTPKKYSCRFCSYTNGMTSLLIQHTKKDHKIDFSLAANQEPVLRKMYRDSKGPRDYFHPFECPFCAKPFYWSSNLHRHMVTPGWCSFSLFEEWVAEENTEST